MARRPKAALPQSRSRLHRAGQAQKDHVLRIAHLLVWTMVFLLTYLIGTALLVAALVGPF